MGNITESIQSWTDQEIIRTKSKLIAERFKLRNEFLETGPWAGLDGRELAEKRLEISQQIELLSDEMLRRAKHSGSQ